MTRWKSFLFPVGLSVAILSVFVLLWGIRFQQSLVFQILAGVGSLVGIFAAFFDLKAELPTSKRGWILSSISVVLALAVGLSSFLWGSVLLHIPPPVSLTPAATVTPPQGTTTPSPLPTATSGPTIVATGTPFPPEPATLVVSDTLQQNSSNSWVRSDTCVFKENAYHDLNQTPNSPPNECYAQTLPTSINTQKIAIQVEMRILSGNYGGIGFGATSGDRYYFSVNVSHQYQINYPGHGWFSCYSGSNGPQPQPGHTQTLCPTSDYSPTQLIQLQMLIDGNIVRFYLNGKLQWVGPNLGISPGTVILVAGFFENNTDLSFQNLKMWQLS